MSLRGLAHAELEALYLGPLAEPPPSGLYQGAFLGFLDNPGARRTHTRVVDTLLFRWTRFGIDFDRRLWWFVDPRLAAGRFRTSIGPSQWRVTETVRLHYEDSLLPGPVRNLLYDEVKPLPDGRVLGLGGLDAGPGQGDHFWFELRSMQ